MFENLNLPRPAPLREPFHGQQQSRPLPKDGGSAFPITEQNGANSGDCGISARDYFAIRAPAEIPDWFQIDSLRPAPALPSDAHLTKGQKFEAEDLRNGIKEADEASIEALAYHRQYTEAQAALHAWQMQHDQARYFAWRWHYADMMLAGRA